MFIVWSQETMRFMIGNCWPLYALTTILEQGPTTIRWELGDWTVEKFEGHNIIFFKGKNHIPKDNELQCDITKMFHNHETAGHPGELETHNAI